MVIKERTMLVIEDELPLVDVIKANLRNNGFAVVTARTVQQALNYLEELKTVDAIWLDHYLLGKEDGLDFVSKIKQDGAKWKNIPIFVISNTASPENIQSYMRLGVKKYFVKAERRLDIIVNEIKSFLDHPEE